MPQTKFPYRPNAPSHFPLESLANNARNGGRRELIAPGMQATLVDINGDDDKSMALTVTLELALRGGIVEGETQLPNPPVRALVEWGNDGMRTQALVDFLNGTTFSVFCTSLRVVGQNLADPDAETLDSVRAGAFVGYMPFGGRQAQLTVTAGGFVNGQSAFSIIPAWARRLFVQSLLGVAAGDFVDFFDSASVLISRSFVGPGTQPVPIPNAARSVRVTIAAAPATATLIYELAL